MLAGVLPSAKLPSGSNLKLHHWRQPVAQESDKIHVLYAHKLCRPTSGVGVLLQTRYWASIESVVVYIRSK